MSEQKKFNIGDRVRIKGDLTKTEHIINKIDGCYCWLLGTDAFIHDVWLEKINPVDRKTDFLTRLSELLREFDAEIEYHIGSDEKSDYSEYYAITIGRERLTYDNCEGASLTADNIMDYDKE